MMQHEDSKIMIIRWTKKGMMADIVSQYLEIKEVINVLDTLRKHHKILEKKIIQNRKHWVPEKSAQEIIDSC